MRVFFNKFIVLLGACIILFIILACRHNNGNNSNNNGYDYIEPQIEDDGYIERVEIKRKNQLIQLAKLGGWDTSTEEIKQTLTSIFNSEIKTRLNITDTLSLSEISSHVLTVEPISNHNRSSDIKECTEFTVKLYSLSAGSFKGYAITSPDKRIGNVIAIIESEYQQDISDNLFAIDFMQKLGAYIQHTADIWNSITDEDLGIGNTATLTVRMPPPPPVVEEQDKYIFTNWKKNGGNGNYILKTQWGQNPTPFNTCVQAVRGSHIKYAGCVTVQIAQILAFHKYSKNMNSPYLAKIKRNWALAKNWDGKYDWNIITSVLSDRLPFSDEQHVQIASFFFDIAETCKAKYTEDATSIYDTVRNNYFNKCGYTWDSESYYSLDKIRTSIDSGLPVPIGGESFKEYKTHSFLGITWKTTVYSGHGFIIDGYYNMSCTGTKKDGSLSIELTEDFVHCNAGWNGLQNGYYIAGVFAMDSSRGPLLPDPQLGRSASPEWTYYYNRNVKQLNNFRPKR